MKKEECISDLDKKEITYEEIKKFLGLVDNLDEERELYFMQNKVEELSDTELVDMLERTKEYALFMWKMLKKMGIVVRGDYDVEKGNNDVKHAYNALLSIEEKIEEKLIEREVEGYEGEKQK